MVSPEFLRNSYYQQMPNGTERTKKFKIRGTNPTRSSVTQFVNQSTANSHSVFHYFPAILVAETGMRQFNPESPNCSCIDGSKNCPPEERDDCGSMPNYGGPDGWGISQLDLSRSGTSAATPLLWDWQSSAAAGISVLQSKVGNHNNFMQALRNCYGASLCDPRNHPVTKTWTANGQSVTFTLEHSDIIKRYNGASGSGLAGGPDLYICGRQYPYSWHYNHMPDGCGSNDEGEQSSGPCPCTDETVSEWWKFYGIDTYSSGLVTDYMQKVTTAYVALNPD